MKYSKHRAVIAASFVLLLLVGGFSYFFGRWKMLTEKYTELQQKNAELQQALVHEHEARVLAEQNLVLDQAQLDEERIKHLAAKTEIRELMQSHAVLHVSYHLCQTKCPHLKSDPDFREESEVRD